MKLSKTEFETLFEGSDAEHFLGGDFTYTNYEDDEFYFYYNGELDEITDKGCYELTETQIKKIKNVLREKYQEHLAELNEERPVIDPYEYYGVSRADFI